MLDAIELQEGASFAQELARNAISNSQNAVEDVNDDSNDNNISDDTQNNNQDDSNNDTDNEDNKDQNDNHQDSDDNADDEIDEDGEIDEDEIKKIQEKEESKLSDKEKELLEKYNESKKPFIVKMKESFGYAEELKDKEYENNQDGLRELVSDVSKIEGKFQLEQIIKQHPSLEKWYDHTVVKGLPEETFMMQIQKPDYSKFDTSTEEGAESMIRLAFSDKEIDKEIIDATIEKYKNEGKLKEKGKLYKDQYDVANAEKIEKLNEQHKLEKQRQLIEDQELQKRTNEIISKGKLRGVTLNANDKRQYLDYLQSVDEETGQPKILVDFNKLDAEDKHFINYQIFKKFKLKGIEDKKINKQTLDDIMKEENNFKETKTIKKSNSKVVDDFSLDFEKANVI